MTSSVWINNTVAVESADRGTPSVWINSIASWPTSYLSKSRLRRIFGSLLAEVILLAFSAKWGIIGYYFRHIEAEFDIELRRTSSLIFRLYNPKAERRFFLSRSRKIEKSAARPIRHPYILRTGRAWPSSWHVLHLTEWRSLLTSYSPARHVGLVVFRVNILARPVGRSAKTTKFTWYIKIPIRMRFGTYSRKLLSSKNSLARSLKQMKQGKILSLKW